MSLKKMKSPLNPILQGIFLICAILIPSTSSARSNSPQTPSTGKVSTISSEWTIPYDGDGSISFDSQDGIVMQPATSTSPYETHAALALSNLTKAHPMKDFQLMIRASTEEQLRTPAPNAWEVFTIFFNYDVDNSGKKNTNYLKLTDNGVELGTLSDKNGQTFLATSKGQMLSLGKINTYLLIKKGNHIDISIDGEPIINFTDTSSPHQFYDVAGSIGLYTEDARVRIHSVEILPL